ncbi:pre-mRNA processing factor 3-domain-containing protein, partial [Protomyces lactucae-debilis]
RGGLATALHPALQDDSLLLASKKRSAKSRFATTMANQKPQEPTQVPKRKQLELLNGVEGFSDTTKNPYYDAKLGGRDLSRPVNRRAKVLQFNPHGKFIEQANEIRREQELKAIRAQQAAEARKAGLEDDFDMSSRLIKKPEPPVVEWWDKPFLQEATDQSTEPLLNESAVTNMVQHPIPIPAPVDLNAPEPKGIMYTKREHKKMRNQDRTAKRKDTQDKQRLGLIPPEPPKVKLSNMMTLYAEEAALDPTKMEQKVRAQMAERRDRHERDNIERMLTKEEKAEKARIKLEEDAARGIHGCAWRVETLASRYVRKRIDDNAHQCALTGVVVLNPRFNLVYIEGGQKSVKFFQKLMENRIAWTEPPRNAMQVDDNEDDPERPDYENNRCTRIWEGELKTRTRRAFLYKKCPTDVEVKDALRD